MRILICTNAYPPHFMGGAELVAHEQAKTLVRLGHEVAVFAGDIGGDGERHGRSEDTYDGVGVYRIKTETRDYDPAFLNIFHPAIDAHFRDVLQTFGPDIVHFHNLTGLSVKLPIIARRSGIRTVCTLHDLWGFCLKNTALRWDGAPCRDMALCQRCLPRISDEKAAVIPMRFRKDFIKLAFDHIDAFVAPSRYIAWRYASAGLAEDRVTVIPNGIDIVRFSPARHTPASGPVRISFVGHFGAHKGVSTLLSAFAMLDGSDRACLQLAGGGPEEARYRTQADALGISDRVRFLGQIDHAKIARVYDQSDIVVLPSVWDENQPVCLMEAMAAGLPVVASNKGGIPELIDHGHNGLLFDAGDVAALALHLDTLVAAPGLRAAMGRAGRQSVEKRTYGNQMASQIAIYASLLDRPLIGAPTARLTGFLGKGSTRTFVADDAAAPGLEDRLHYSLPYAWMSEYWPMFDKFFVLIRGPLARLLKLAGYETVLRYPRWLHDLQRTIRSGFSK